MILSPESTAWASHLSRTIARSLACNVRPFHRRVTHSPKRRFDTRENRVAEFHTKIKTGIYEIPFIDPEPGSFDRHGDGPDAAAERQRQKQGMLQHRQQLLLLLQEIAA